jgi:hypothetical protein
MDPVNDFGPMFDRPFRGDLGLSPGPFELVYDQLMKPKP